MTTSVERLQQSFRKFTPKADILAANFYEILFERYPDTLPLFGGVRFDEQKKKLIRALALVVRNIERPDFLRAYLQGLGAMHVAYGVLPEHYPMVGECLIEAMSQTAGKWWEPETEAAWREAYGMISDIMLGGAGRMS
jgi:hemoglobin-like flavoprotein